MSLHQFSSPLKSSGQEVPVRGESPVADSSSTPPVLKRYPHLEEISANSIDDSMCPVSEESSPVPHEEGASGEQQSLYEAQVKIREKNEVIRRLQHTIKELASRLHGVAQFIDMREDIEDRIVRMETEYEEELTECQDESRNARLELLENRVHIRSVEQMLRETHNTDVSMRATQLLDERTKEVNAQNFELVRDKLLLAKDMELTREKCGVLEEKNAVLRRKADLATTSESELLHRSVRQKREIVELKKQIKVTEDNMTQMAEKYEAQLKLQEKAHVKVVRRLTAERDEARTDAQKLRRELVQLRSVSAKVVAQRSEMETFFYEALKEVRENILAERRQQIKGGACSSPAVAANQTASSALRLETQGRLQITEHHGSMYSGSPTHTRRLWTTDAKGFPVLMDSTKMSGKALPPIPSSAPTNARRSPRSGAEQHSRNSLSQPACVNSGGDETEAPQDDGEYEHFFFEGTGTAAQSIPDAPDLTNDIQRVDISDLAWVDKERVIRLLFTRLRRQQQQQARKVATNVSLPGVKQIAAEDTDTSSLVFLTQQ